MLRYVTYKYVRVKEFYGGMWRNYRLKNAFLSVFLTFGRIFQQTGSRPIYRLKAAENGQNGSLLDHISGIF